MCYMHTQTCLHVASKVQTNYRDSIAGNKQHLLRLEVSQGNNFRTVHTFDKNVSRHAKITAVDHVHIAISGIKKDKSK